MRSNCATAASTVTIQLADAIARHVTQVEQPQGNVAALEVLDGAQCIERGTKHPVHLRGDDDVSSVHHAQQLRSLRPSGEWCRAGDASVNIDAIEVPAVFEAARLDLALLLVEADARIGLLIGRHTAIAVGGALNVGSGSG